MASNAKDKANLLNLPPELRRHIFHDYFKVEGGYVYDAKTDSLKTADNRPIELSLMSTCRSIANDTRHLPLSINTVKFSTLYREDWRSLAGCFNLVASYFAILQSDFIVHLAQFMTEDMLAQLALKYPKFVPHLRLNMAQHEDYIAMVDEKFEYWHNSGEPASAAEPESESSKHNMRINLCLEIEQILGMYATKETLESHEYSSAFAAIDNHFNYHLRILWPGNFWEIQGGLSYGLQILAENKPTELAQHVAKTFPSWTGEHPIQTFMGLRFNPWEIPSESGVLQAIRLLQLRDVWNLPNMWHHTPNWRHGDDNPLRDYHLSEPDRRDELHYSSGVRCREKIRFSAVASAIHFLQGRICASQRTHIRSLVLHEDLPSVNNPSCHVLGLAPFFRENPLLRVERHVDWLKSISIAVDNPFDVAAHFQLGWELQPKMHKSRVGQPLAHWLVDALAVTDAGIPAEAFTFVLEPGPYIDFCTDIFQRYAYLDIAWSRSYKAMTESKSFIAGPYDWEQVGYEIFHDEDMEALNHLIKGTSPILRCNFNLGVVQDFENVVKEIKGLDFRRWARMWYDRHTNEEPHGRILLPSEFTYESWAADLYEIQTEDDYQPRRINVEEVLQRMLKESR